MIFYHSRPVYTDFFYFYFPSLDFILDSLYFLIKWHNTPMHMTCVYERGRERACVQSWWVDDHLFLPIALGAERFLSSTQTDHHEDNNVTVCYH